MKKYFEILLLFIALISIADSTYSQECILYRSEAKIERTNSFRRYRLALGVLGEQGDVINLDDCKIVNDSLFVLSCIANTFSNHNTPKDKFGNTVVPNVEIIRYRRKGNKLIRLRKRIFADKNGEFQITCSKHDINKYYYFINAKSKYRYCTSFHLSEDDVR